eukprot:m.167378 g.167378  ORF g.167378 m.167378 type:complete len:585 (-) comp17194_c1_seq2:1886-3640(-)
MAEVGSAGNPADPASGAAQAADVDDACSGNQRDVAQVLPTPLPADGDDVDDTAAISTALSDAYFYSDDGSNSDASDGGDDDDTKGKPRSRARPNGDAAAAEAPSLPSPSPPPPPPKTTTAAAATLTSAADPTTTAEPRLQTASQSSSSSKATSAPAAAPGKVTSLTGRTLETYMLLPTLLEDMFDEFMTAAQREISMLPTDSATPAAIKDAEAQIVLKALGQGLSLRHGPSRSPDTFYGPTDIACMLFSDTDFIGMSARPPVFKIGGALPDPTSDFADTEVDRHRPFCGCVFDVTTLITDYHSRAKFPVIVYDQKIVFETARGAAAYERRAWRLLSGNVQLPLPTSDNEARTSLVHSSRRCPETFGIDLGQRCRLFNAGTELPAFVPTLGNAPLPKNMIADSVLVVFREANVVNRLYVASRVDKVPLVWLQEMVRQARNRVRTWSASTNVQNVLNSLPAPLLGHRRCLYDLWRKAVRDFTATASAQSPFRFFSAEPCVVCGRTEAAAKRCAGCRAFAYCSQACQGKHWAVGHKKDCSLEFSLVTCDSRIAPLSYETLFEPETTTSATATTTALSDTATSSSSAC